jgi:hypothetical protein
VDARGVHEVDRAQVDVHDARRLVRGIEQDLAQLVGGGKVHLSTYPDDGRGLAA